MTPRKIQVDNEWIHITFADNEINKFPICKYPRLVHGTYEERNHYIITRRGICWPSLGEFILTNELLNGEVSDESDSSLEEWVKEIESKRIRYKKNSIPFRTFTLVALLQFCIATFIVVYFGDPIRIDWIAIDFCLKIFYGILGIHIFLMIKDYRKEIK